MERLNSGESKTIFRNISCIVIIGLTTSGRKAWQEEEETRKDTSIVLIRQERSCTSELFKVIQDAVSLILLYRTMLLFRATSSSTFITSDVQSIHIPSSIQDWYQEVKIWATDRQYSFCLWIPWTKTIRAKQKGAGRREKKELQLQQLLSSHILSCIRCTGDSDTSDSWPRHTESLSL